MNAAPDRRRAEAGLATVELALVLPLLLALLFGAVHFAGLFFLESNMLNASRDAARRLAVGEFTAGQAEAAIEDALASWPAEFDVAITLPDGGDPDDRDVIVEVSTTVADAGLVEFISSMHPGTLRARVTMRLE
jgi:hypothetical protein